MKHPSLLAPTLALLLAALVGCGSGSGSSSAGGGAPLDAPGSASTAILTAQTHDALRVRVFYEPGLAPEPAALAFLERRLLERVHKPGGVLVELAGELGASQERVRGEVEVRRLAAALPSSGEEGRYTIDVLYLAGSSSADDGHGHETQLGSSVGARTIAVYVEEVRRSSTSSLNPVELEGALLVHEAGHLLGLVGLGLPLTAPHADRTRPGHCVNSPCVMNARSPFWSGQKIQLGIALTGGGPPDFCPDCQADLRAGGGL